MQVGDGRRCHELMLAWMLTPLNNNNNNNKVQTKETGHKYK